MNFAVQTALLLALLVVCCFVPGFFFVRRFRWTPLEKLCASVALSLIVLYLDTAVIYVVSGGPGGTRLPVAPFALSSIVFVVLGAVMWKDFRRLIRSLRAKRAFLGFGFLFLWTLVILSTIRVYSGGDWTGDWNEHFQRTIFFLQRLPANTIFGDVYSVPARPPFMNVLATFFLAQMQDRFEFFEIVFCFLNLLVFLPACLMMTATVGPRLSRTLPLVLVLALNPAVMQNATYSWTKALTAFFVLLGLALYISARRRADSQRMVAAFVSLAAGILVHYSSGAYVIVIAVHYMFWTFWKRQRKWKELAIILVTCTLLLATYFGWAVAVYGEGAIRSISTISPEQQNEGNPFVRSGANLIDSLVPSLLHHRAAMINSIEQPNPIGKFRDIAFQFYQPNVLFAMGLIGGPVALWLLYQHLRRNWEVKWPNRTFWIGFLASSLVLGATAVGGRYPLGLAHGMMLPLEVLGLTLLASAISRKGVLSKLLLAGCLLDFSIGIFLHAHVQSFEGGAGKTFFSDLIYSNGMVRHDDPGPDTLSKSAWQNWFVKHQRALCDRWLSELPERHGGDATFQSVWPAYRAEIERLKKQDDLQWGGWYSRHSGEIQFLGDHVVGSVGEGPSLTFLVILLAGILVVFINQKPVAVLIRRKPRGKPRRR